MKSVGHEVNDVAVSLANWPYKYVERPVSDRFYHHVWSRTTDDSLFRDSFLGVIIDQVVDELMNSVRRGS